MIHKAEFLFIDTSVFVQENFMEGKRIRSILELAAKGYLRLFFSAITLKEIKNQFKKRVGVAYAQHNVYIKDKARHGIRVLRNNSRGKMIFDKLPNEQLICEEFNHQLDAELAGAKATILPYPTLDITPIFEHYFSGQAPFGNGEKKHEFPDAFAIAHIEQWCTTNNTPAVFLTNDKDFTTIPGEFVTVVTNYEDFLNDKIKQVVEARRLIKLDDLYQLNAERIDRELVIWVEEQFDDDGLFDDVTNWMEILDRKIEYVKVLAKEYELIGNTEETLEIEITATLSYRVAIETYDEYSGTYDSEDKVMLYRDTTTCIAEQEDLELTMKVLFYIKSVEEFDPDYELIDINYGKDIDIRPDGAYDYY